MQTILQSGYITKVPIGVLGEIEHVSVHVQQYVKVLFLNF